MSGVDSSCQADRSSTSDKALPPPASNSTAKAPQPVLVKSKQNSRIIIAKRIPVRHKKPETKVAEKEAKKGTADSDLQK